MPLRQCVERSSSLRSLTSLYIGAFSRSSLTCRPWMATVSPPFSSAEIQRVAGPALELFPDLEEKPQMSDSFSESSSTGGGSSLLESIKGVLFGLILFVVSSPLLFWNEGRAVRTAKGLTEGLGSVVSVPIDGVDASKEGKLIHVSGAVKTDAPVADDELGVQATAVKLIRNVEMFQWKEHEKSESHKKLGGGTETVKTWDYQKEWAAGRIDSSSFKHPEGHENPPAPPFETKTFAAKKVTVGAFTMSPEQIGQLSNAVSLPVDAAAEQGLPAGGRDNVKGSDGEFYQADDPASPKIGDVRISFQTVNPSTVSLVGVQTGQTFAPYQ